MAILKIEEYENSGIIKEFAAGAEDLIFKNVQTEYQFPIKSFIRETFSNGIDSIREKEAAMDIILNKVPISNYFIHRTEAVVSDSNFDPDYYDFDYLSDSQKVKILYHHKSHSERDLAIITDEGVGLSGSRLKGYFKIGFSSKRNSAFALGKFGMGAKAGLATNVDYFQMTTRYNGKETSFLVYLRNYVCVIPKAESTKTELWEVQKSVNGVVENVKQPIYWKDTDKPNGVEVTLEIRKHNAEKFKQAVRDQLLYFQNSVEFATKHDDSNKSVIDLKQDILFETDNCIVSRYNQFNAPHLVVEGVNYGVIYWAELDLEDKSGRVGVKVPASDVSVNQPREIVKYDTLTRNTILNKIDLVTKDVTDYLSSKLEVDELLPWLKAASDVVYNTEDPIISAMSGFIDKTQLELHREIPEIHLKLSKDLSKLIPKKLRANRSTFDLIFANYRVSGVTNESDSNVIIDNFKYITNTNFVLGTGSTVLSKKLKAYICYIENITEFVYLRPLTIEDTDQRINAHSKVCYSESKVFSDIILKPYVKLLSSYTPTEEFNKLYKEENSEEDENVDITEAAVILSPKERRAKNKSIHYKELTRSYGYGNIFNNMRWTQAEAKIDSIPYDKVIYGTTVHKKLLEFLYVLFHYTRDKNFTVIRIGKDNEKYFKDGIHAEQYLKQMTNTGFKLGTELKKFNTMYKLSTMMYDNYTLKWLITLSNLVPEYADFINANKDMISISSNLSYDNEEPNYSKLSALQPDSDIADELVEFMDKSMEINMLSASGEIDEATTKCKEYFGSDNFLDIDAIDYNLITTMQEIADKMKPIEKVISSIGTSMTQEVADLLLILLDTLNKNSN